MKTATKVRIFARLRKKCAGKVSPYTPMHEVTPKVVAMAVSTVITMFRILLQRSLLFMMFQFSFV